MKHQQTVRALLELSGHNGKDLPGEVANMVKNAPDPETAIQYILSLFPIRSGALEEKWRKYIGELWIASHMHVPYGLHVPLMSKEVVFSPVLLEVHTLMQELAEHPAQLHEDAASYFLDPAEEERIAWQLPLFMQESLHVRRVCALLEELRLIRPYKGTVRIVQHRYRQFQAFPLPVQYYLVWHSDMYHLNWDEYANTNAPHLAFLQHYLPVVWEVLSSVTEGGVGSRDAIAAQIIRSFYPVWQQYTRGVGQQMLLEEMIEKWLIDKVFIRYGLITEEDSGTFHWTSVGQKLLELERAKKLPCSTDALR